MNKFVDAVKIEAAEKFTENGAFAYNSTGNSALLDLFGVVGALRTRSEDEIETKFADAYNENWELAMRLLFYTRNIRGGLGERRTFRIMLKWLCREHIELAEANIPNVVEFGRFDDLYTYVDTPAEYAMWEYLSDILTRDYEQMLLGHPVSLCAKWLKSINTSSNESRRLARMTMQNLGFKTEKQYRKVLARLRKYLEVTEHQMSAQEWDKINYSHVPAYAIKNYGSAFATHDFERWNQYLNDLKNHKEGVKVNAGTLYPYDLVEKISGDSWYGTFKYDELTEQQWKALPNYVQDGANVLIMADVSGSMTGRPMATSIGLANYFAQRNHGAFAGLYMTFTGNPHYITVSRNDSLQAMCKKAFTDVGYNTDLNKAFRLIYNTAVQNHVPQKDLPRALVVISDMEIDNYIRYNNMDFLQKWKQLFREAGYEMPQLVCWNVNARNDTFLAQAAEKGIKYLSGSSVSVFKDLISTLNCESAYDAMIKVLMNKMYDRVITELPARAM